MQYFDYVNESGGTVGYCRRAGPAGTDGQVAAVRDFNRFYTNVLGLLREGLLDTPYSLTEARIIFELARADEAEVAAPAPLARHRRRAT